MLLFLEEMKPHSFFFLASHCLFMANTAHPQCSPVSSSLRGCHQPWPVGEWGHVTDRSCECTAQRVCLQLTVKPSCELVHLPGVRSRPPDPWTPPIATCVAAPDCLQITPSGPPPTIILKIPSFQDYKNTLWQNCPCEIKSGIWNFSCIFKSSDVFNCQVAWIHDVKIILGNSSLPKKL
jgi:hypothetical protein